MLLLKAERARASRWIPVGLVGLPPDAAPSVGQLFSSGRVLSIKPYQISTLERKVPTVLRV